MSLAAFLIPSSLDAKQGLRLRRFGLAALTYAVSTGIRHKRDDRKAPAQDVQGPPGFQLPANRARD